ncbi:hypothetical protein [Haliangium sp.]|uniref:hypothetical protein n=1 Tax=Haliangium sp. TaxID=2663208 RepID=UPI003D12CC16
MDDDRKILVNGVNAVTGDYALPAMDVGKLADLIRGGGREDEGVRRWLKDWYERSHARRLSLIEGIDPRDLGKTGWGVIFADDASPEVKEAMQPLLALREQQAGERYRVFDGKAGHRVDEDTQMFMARYRIGAGPVDPARGVPYYLLVVGSPERIPFRFQYLFDVQFALGRLCFDTADEYARYANSVVAAETGRGPFGTGAPLGLPRRCGMFGVVNEGDMATRLSTNLLVEPLAKWLVGTPDPDMSAGTPAPAGWEVHEILRERATPAALAELLAADAPPALLFTASHGMEFPAGHERQRDHQGALLGAGWSRGMGPSEIDPSLYISGDDLGDARVHGMIAFLFACYGGGTPRRDDFAHRSMGRPVEIAPEAFVARLPQRLLAHPKGGALAVLAHVERAWTHSFLGARNSPQLTVFEDMVRRLLEGQPVGAAMEPLNLRHSELATRLADAYERIGFGAGPGPEALVKMWTAHSDARNFIVLGDPAVRIAARAV